MAQLRSLSTVFQALAVVSSLALAGCGGGGGSAESLPVDRPPADDPDTYAAQIYTDTQLASSLDVQYSTRSNDGRHCTSDLRCRAELSQPTLNLLLDVWVPPNASSAAPQPLVVWIHGGAFAAGDKAEFRDKALTYARAGFVAASINYRLVPNNTDSAALRSMAVHDAVEDAANAVRYLRHNAARFHIDPTRVAVIGSSAGGATALGLAIDADTLPGMVKDFSELARPQAVVSTGATLIDAYFDSLADLSFDASDAPVLLFHANPTDGTTGATWDGNVVPTADLINGSGNSCTLSTQANLTHTVDLSVSGNRWDEVRPFLWERLQLAELL